MAIIRRAERRTNFSIIPNELINDEFISWESQALLIYLLSKPNNWEVNMSHLEYHKKKKIDNDKGFEKRHGKDKIRSMINELIQIGYINRKNIKDSNGRFNWIYTVFDEKSANTSN